MRITFPGHSKKNHSISEKKESRLLTRYCIGSLSKFFVVSWNSSSILGLSISLPLILSSSEEVWREKKNIYARAVRYGSPFCPSIYGPNAMSRGGGGGVGRCNKSTGENQDNYILQYALIIRYMYGGSWNLFQRGLQEKWVDPQILELTSFTSELLSLLLHSLTCIFLTSWFGLSYYRLSFGWRLAREKTKRDWDETGLFAFRVTPPWIYPWFASNQKPGTGYIFNPTSP